MTRNPASHSSSPFLSLRYVALYMATPYLLGLLITKNADVLSGWWKQPSSASSPRRDAATRVPKNQLDTKQARGLASSPESVGKCHQALLQKLSYKGGPKREETFDNVAVVVHRNGDTEPCAEFTFADFSNDFQAIIQELDACPHWDDKYVVESFLTRYFHKKVAATCHSLEADRTPEDGFYGFCDMGESRTPILLDHLKLVPIRDKARNATYLPCHFHNRQGVRMTSFSALARNANELLPGNDQSNDPGCRACAAPYRELHLYAVPAGRVFMFAPSRVGELIDLPHVTGADPHKPVYLEVLSLQPRVFDLHNFFTRDESETLINTALKESREDYRIKRSSTGNTGYRVNPQRTSESGFDTSSKTAVQLKRRCFDVLGFDEYIEAHSDGLQMLRYNLTTSYISHMDYMDIDDKLPHDYDSVHKGGNRYATILLYMTDLEEKDGGETVFTEAWPVNQTEEEHVQFDTALQQLRDSGDAAMLAKDSWQEHMVARCRSRMTVRPHAGRSVLFYSQHPNGTADKSSLHGGCPVLSGTKYAANLWVWNTPRAGFAGHPKNPKFKDDVDETGYVKKTALFVNTKENPDFKAAELYYEEQFWAKLGHGDPEAFVNTFDGHVWHLKVNGAIVKTWTIGGSEKEFVFKV